jgi:hypothetical protein
VADTASSKQWKDLWDDRSTVCADVFYKQPIDQADLPNRVRLRNELSQTQHAGAVKDFEALTAYFKESFECEPEEQPILAPLALWAPDKSSWDSLYTKAMRDFNAQIYDEHGPGQG